MTQQAISYAQTLRKTDVSGEILQDVIDILDTVPQIQEEFENPMVGIERKHLIIDKVFPGEIRNFLKILCDNNEFELFKDIVEEWEKIGQTSENSVNRAQLIYVTAPSEQQLTGIRKFLAKEFHNENMQLETKQDASLKSGFILRVGTKEYDWSEQGRIEQLKEQMASKVSLQKTLSEESIISILKAKVEDFELETRDKEIGIVKWVGDGIVNVDGIDHARYGEIVIFDCGVKGMVQDVRRDEIGVILFGRDTEIHEGSRVVRTGKMAGIPVGEKFEESLMRWEHRLMDREILMRMDIVRLKIRHLRS